MKPNLLWTYILLSLVLLAGCKGGGGGGTGSTGEVTKSCIANGVTIKNSEYPAVQRIYINGGYTCSGTFISDEYFLTAAHCVSDSNNNIREPVWIYGTGIQSLWVEKNGKFDINALNIAEDLAIVKFPAGSAQGILQLAQENPQSDDDFVIVGFGDQNGDFSKKKGSNSLEASGVNVQTQGLTLQSIQSGLLIFEGEKDDVDGSGSNASSEPGDSGGPLLIDGRIAGVTSAGIDDDTEQVSLYVNIRSSYGQEFLGSVLPSDVFEATFEFVASSFTSSCN
jgi:hypothetical protein